MLRKIILLLALLPFICSEGLSQSRIFWLDNDHDSPPYNDESPPRIRSARLDGTHVQRVKRVTDATGMAFDHEHGYIYWTQEPLKTYLGILWRFTIDQSGPNEHVYKPEWTEGGLAIDYVDDKIYWATRLRDWHRVTIMRANLDGMDPEEIASDISVYCKGLAIDPVGKHVYWTTNETILRASLDTGVVEDVGPDPNLPPYPAFDGDISIDVQARKMYWTRGGNRSSSGWIGAFRANLDGSEAELLWEEPYSDAGDIVVDGVNKYVYWTEWTLMTDPTGVFIRRARTDQPITWDRIENIVGPPDTPADLTRGIDLFIDPGPPALEIPAAEAAGVATTTELRWQRVECSPRYDVQVASDSAFNSIVYRTNTPHQTDTFVAPVAQHRYWWRVHSNACGIASHWSSPRWFDVGSSGALAPALLTPKPGEQTGLTVMFSWNPGPDAAHHTFQLSTTNDFSTAIVDAESLMVAEYEVENLVSGQSYYWRVAGFDDGGRYTFAATQSFSIANKPDAVTLIGPSDGATEVPAYTVFEWNEAGGADSYRFELSTSSDFESIIVDENVEGTSYELATPLPYAEEHFWRVCGVNIAGEGPWASRSFTVAVGTATEPPGEIPKVTVLRNAYPNPSSGVVHLPFDLAQPGNVQIDVYDVFGRHVLTPLDESLNAGRYIRALDIAGLASGMYVAVLKAGVVQARTVFTVVR